MLQPAGTENPSIQTCILYLLLVISRSALKRLIDCKTPELCTMKEIVEEMK